MNQAVVGRWALLGSVVLHAWIFSGEAAARAPRVSHHPAQVVEFVMAQVEPPPEPVETPPEPEPEPEKEAPQPEQVAAPRDPLPESAEVPAASEEAPQELTGTTLVAEEGGAAFFAQVGSGRERRGVFRTGVSRPSAATSQPSSPSPGRQSPKEPSFVPVGQLSRPPAPPDLGELLQRNYPSVARKRGQSGEAKVRARIEPSGRVERASVTFETSEGFGKACRDTLLGSRWTSPRDEKGKRVATWVNYRCKFRIDG